MRDAQEQLLKSNNMFNVSKLQSAGGKLTELLEQNYSIHCDQNNSKIILSHGKFFFFVRLCLLPHTYWGYIQGNVFQWLKVRCLKV